MISDHHAQGREPAFPSQRIAADLTASIRIGQLRSGEQLPTVAALCQTYSVSRVTVLKALSQLRAAGLITTVPRWGSFVA